jgi:hypothetical protein
VVVPQHPGRHLAEPGEVSDGQHGPVTSLDYSLAGSVSAFEVAVRGDGGSGCL